jgi:hypothetical protein
MAIAVSNRDTSQSPPMPSRRARPGHAEGAERAADDRRVEVPEGGVRNADLVGHVPPQVGKDHVADAHQVLEDAPAGRIGQVQLNALLVPVEGLEKQAVLIVLERRDVAPNVTAGARILDFDHLGAEIGQVHAAERAGAVLLQRKNPHVFQRLHEPARPVPAPAPAERRAASTAVRSISLPTIIIPSSTPMPGLANTRSAPQAMATCAETCAERSVSLHVPPQ